MAVGVGEGYTSDYTPADLESGTAGPLITIGEDYADMVVTTASDAGSPADASDGSVVAGTLTAGGQVDTLGDASPLPVPTALGLQNLTSEFDSYGPLAVPSTTPFEDVINAYGTPAFNESTGAYGGVVEPQISESGTLEGTATNSASSSAGSQVVEIPSNATSATSSSLTATATSPTMTAATAAATAQTAQTTSAGSTTQVSWSIVALMIAGWAAATL